MKYDLLDEIQQVKEILIKTFGIDFYNAYVENSDGISGRKFIKLNFSLNQINKILELSKNKDFVDFKNNCKNQSILDNLENIFTILNNLKKSENIINLSDYFLKENYDFLEKEFIRRINLKNKSNYTKEEMFSDSQLRDSISFKIKERWQNAYNKNFEINLNLPYIDFEKNIIQNLLYSTMNYF